MLLCISIVLYTRFIFYFTNAMENKLSECRETWENIIVNFISLFFQIGDNKIWHTLASVIKICQQVATNFQCGLKKVVLFFWTLRHLRMILIVTNTQIKCVLLFPLVFYSPHFLFFQFSVVVYIKTHRHTLKTANTRLNISSTKLGLSTHRKSNFYFLLSEKRSKRILTWTSFAFQVCTFYAFRVPMNGLEWHL